MHAFLALSVPLFSRALPATWTLVPGRALRLRAVAPAQLRVTEGGLWLTGDGPHAGAGNDLGDVFLQAGQSLCVAAGRQLVIESWSPVRGQVAQASFSWEAQGAVRVPQGEALGAGFFARPVVRLVAGLRALTAASSASKAQGCMG